ncbi:MAG: ribbon-helix-helix protein, CopG family [Actinobacteria bacterium]|nr:ribbon-helix-helix protein, CopG family [Actinomycetota bacterium]
MKRTQIQLTDKQYKLLKELSSEKNISMAEVIREAFSFYSSSTATIARDARIRDALSIIGKYNSGKKDISIKHDEYLEKAFKEKDE